MGLKCAAVFLLLSLSPVLFAQCAENNYVHDGAPSSQLDCQPLAALQQVSPDAMAARDQQLVADRHADLVAAARFYGFEIDDAGWSYQQAISPLLRRHILLTFTNATPANRASRFIAIVPADSGDKVQVVPAFARGLHPYLPGWQSKGSVSAFNRLMNRERGVAPISHNSDWIDYAVLYLTLAGRSPSIPTETDSVKANWDLSVKRGTTPVIVEAKDGSATMAFSDLEEGRLTISWKLAFNRQGQILKADRQENSPVKVKRIQTEDQTTARAR